jgi:hypothetical protein
MTAVRRCLAALLLLALGACCDVFGSCRPECMATPMPSASTDPKALSYHLGPPSCLPSAVADARAQAQSTCRGRGTALAADAPLITTQPPVPPLDAASSATFLCQ